MAKNRFDIAFRLGAKVQSSMGNAFNTANKNINNMNRRLKETQRQSNVVTQSMNKMSGAMKAVAGAAVAYVGISAMKQFASESVELAKAQLEVETKLDAILQNVKSIQAQGPNAYKKTAAELKNYASELQGVGVIGDEITIAGMQQLATFQMSGEAIKTVSGGMLDLLAQQKGMNASQKDAVSIGNMIGKVMNGQTSSLSRLGITFTEAQEHILKTGTEMERAAALAQVLQDNVGGVNESLALTDDGQIQQMKNAWGDYKEEIGKKILPEQAKFAKWFITKIPRIQSITTGAIDKISSGFSFVGKMINKTKPYVNVLTSSFGGLGKELSWLKDLGKQALNTIKGSTEGNLPTIDSFKSKVKVATGYLQSGFEKARPHIEWLVQTGLPTSITFIGNVVSKAKEFSGFIKNNWSTIKPTLIGIGIALGSVKVAMVALSVVQTVTMSLKAFKAATTAAKLSMLGLNGAMLANPMTWVIAGIVALIAVGVLLYKNWDTVKEKAGVLWSAVKVGFGKIGSFITDMWDGVKASTKSAVNGMIGAINFLIRSANSFSIDIPDWVPKVGGKSFGIKIPEIPMLAKGGITTGPTLAMIGEGAEQEAVLPLSKLDGLLNGSKSKGNPSGNEDFSIQVNNHFEIHGNADTKEIKQMFNLSHREIELIVEQYFARKRRLAFNK